MQCWSLFVALLVVLQVLTCEAQDANLAPTATLTPVLDGTTYAPTVANGQYSAGTGIGGSTSFYLQPNTWYSPSITMVGALWRADFSVYSDIELWVKCPASPAPLLLNFQRWTSNNIGGSSNKVDLSKYATPATTGGLFGNSWTRVVAPMSAFATADWTLKGVERFFFNSDTQNRRCYVDNISLLKTRSPSLTPTLTPTLAPSREPSSFRPTRSEAVVDTTTLTASWGVDPLFDGEVNSYTFTSVEYAAPLPGVGVLGSVGLELQSDPWHSPSLLLSSPVYRSDVGRYNELNFHVRCVEDETPLYIHFGRWTPDGVGGSSASVPVGNFAVPADVPMKNTIGKVWTKISIPVSVFQTAAWDLRGAERIYFNLDSLRRKCYLDNMYLVTDKVPSAPPTVMPSLKPTPAPSTARPTRVLPGTMEPFLEAVLGVEPLWDGENSSFNSLDIRYAARVAGTGVLGTYGLELRQDPWHAPTFLLRDPVYRSEVKFYNELLMYARCEQEDTPLSVHFGRWTFDKIASTSKSVYLANYAEPRDEPVKNTIGTTWTKVRIPIPEFFAPDWELAGAEWLYFNAGCQFCKCWVDNVLIRENVGPYVVGTKLLTASVLQVETNKYYEHQTARTLTNYFLEDTATGAKLFPESIGLQSRFQNFRDRSAVPWSRYWINLIFPSSIDCSKSYNLHMANVTDPALNVMNYTVWPFTCDGPVQTNAIKVNQEGYLPDRSKFAYVGDYYGDNGGGVWAVGAQGSVWSWNRIQKTFVKAVLPEEARTRNLRGVAVNSPTDIWVVGDGGIILHNDGTQWMVVSSPTTKDLYDIEFNPNRTEAFAVGDQGTILKFTPNGVDTKGVWSVATPVTTVDLRTVWLGSSIMWIGGASGTILRRYTTSPIAPWTIVPPLTNATILHIEGVRTDYAVAAICSNGLRLKNQWGGWSVEQQYHSNIRSLALNPTFNKVGRVVGLGGMGAVVDYSGESPFTTGTTEDLTSVVLLEESIAFAFGTNGACVTGSVINSKPWKACSLPEPADVFKAVSLMEGPLRLKYPLSTANLQKQTTEGTWESVGQYPVRVQTMNYVLSGEDVYIVDFSEVRAAGSYRLLIDGLGYSHSFTISNAALEKAAYHTCRMMYYQRSAMPEGLVTPYAEERFTHPIDHEFNTTSGGRKIDGAYHWSVAQSPLYDNEVICPLKTKDCPAESFRDGAGGWFDAGDYSKYMATATPTVWRLLMTVDVLRERNLPLTDSFNLPESNDNVPDTLNEAAWGIRWIMKMQKEDGGVFNKLASELWESGSPETSDLGGQFVRFFMERTTHDTATAGAVFAMAARHWSSYDADFAAEMMRRAQLAKSFLEVHVAAAPEAGFRNPPGHVSGPYYDTDDTDNRAWLYAELYRTSCNPTDGQKYVDFIIANNNIVGMGGNDFVDYRIEAAWAFVHAVCPNEPAVFASTRKLARAAILRSAEGSRSRTLANTYKNIGRTDVAEWIGWGSGTLTWAQLFGIMGWHLTNDANHLDWLTINLDSVLGANPMGVSYVTGLGKVYPMDPLQGQSRSDQVIEPIPGYVVMGPFGHVSFQNSFFAAAQGTRSNYPYLTQLTSPFPVMRRWSDSNLLPQYNEGGVGPISIQCAVFQILNAVAQNTASST